MTRKELIALLNGKELDGSPSHEFKDAKLNDEPEIVFCTAKGHLVLASVYPGDDGNICIDLEDYEDE